VLFFEEQNKKNRRAITPIGSLVELAPGASENRQIALQIRVATLQARPDIHRIALDLVESREEIQSICEYQIPVSDHRAHQNEPKNRPDMAQQSKRKIHDKSNHRQLKHLPLPLPATHAASHFPLITYCIKNSRGPAAAAVQQ
jgi:hypothetical protein